MTAAEGWTPGPWEVGRAVEVLRFEDLPRFWVIRNTSGYSPAIVAAWDVDQGQEGDLAAEEALANARLIAAAPDLLEALVGLLSDIRPENIGSDGWSTDPVHKDEIDKARAAIARAQGGAA